MIKHDFRGCGRTNCINYPYLINFKDDPQDHAIVYGVCPDCVHHKMFDYYIQKVKP